MPAQCVVLPVRCPGLLGSCSPVTPLGVLSWATRLLFTNVPAQCVVLRVRCPGPRGSRSPMCPLGLLCCTCVVLGHLAPVHRCARSVRWFAFAVSGATWLLFTGVPARCVVLRVRLLGHLAPVHRCARSSRCFACAVSWATWLLFTGVPEWSVVSRLRCPGQLGSCSPVRPLGALLCCCGVLGHLAPVHRCARSVRCVVCAVSWATWLLFTDVPAPSCALLVRCPARLGSCSRVHSLGVLCCVCSVLGDLAPVHGCTRSVCCVASAVSWATWLLFTGAPAQCLALLLRCPGSLGSGSSVCLLGAFCCVCGLLNHFASIHRCARSVRCFACAVSWATWLLLTGVPPRGVLLRVRCPGPLGSCCGGVPARCVVLCARCPGPLGSCSPVCLLRPVLCSCSVLSHLAPVHRCTHSVCCVACAVSWATWLLFIGVPAWFVLLRLRCPGPLSSCSPVRPLRALLCCCGVRGHLALVHQCACSLRFVACVAS